MITLLKAGRAVFAAAIVVFGLLCFIHGQPVSGLQPLPAWLPAPSLWAYATGVVLVLCGLGLLTARSARMAALALAALLLLWFVTLHAPIVIAAPRNGSAWVAMFETLAAAAAAVVLAGMASAAGDDRLGWVRAGRYAFAISLPVFAASHFIYAGFVATLVPAWIPAPLFWAWFTGAAHLAAGLAVLTGVQARLAALLAGAMYGTWALILHLPRVASDPGNRAEITSLVVAVALCGAAWIIAGSIASRAHCAAPAGSRRASSVS